MKAKVICALLYHSSFKNEKALHDVMNFFPKETITRSAGMAIRGESNIASKGINNLVCDFATSMKQKPNQTLEINGIEPPTFTK